MLNVKAKVAVFITAYNEEGTIGDVLSLIDESYDVYVISDGSTDRTISIAKKQQVKIISHPLNLGQGMAVLTAFKLLLPKDYDIIVEMDGDGQHAPQEIQSFVNKIQESGIDIVVGSRILGLDYKGAPWARKFFLPVLTWVINKLTGYQMTDAMCGFRAFRVKALKDVTYIFDSFEEPQYLASEMWIRFANAGLTVSEVPVTLAGRKCGFSYKGLFRYGWGVLTTIIKTTLDLYKDKYQVKTETKKGESK